MSGGKTFEIQLQERHEAFHRGRNPGGIFTCPLCPDKWGKMPLRYYDAVRHAERTHPTRHIRIITKGASDGGVAAGGEEAEEEEDGVEVLPIDVTDDMTTTESVVDLSTPEESGGPVEPDDVQRPRPQDPSEWFDVASQVVTDIAHDLGTLRQLRQQTLDVRTSTLNMQAHCNALLDGLHAHDAAAARARARLVAVGLCCDFS